MGRNTLSLEELAIGTQTDSQTSKSSASSKTVCQKMSRKPEDIELADEENKQLDPGGKGGSHRFEKRMYWYSFLFVGDVWTWMPDLFLLLLSGLFRFIFRCRENQVMIFLRPEESMGGERRTNGDANQVDEEHNWRASIFLPINPLKISTTRFDFLATRCWG